MNEKPAPFAMDISFEYPEIQFLATGAEQTRFNLATIFPDRKGFGVKRHNKKRIEYLIQAKPLLLKMLHDGEVIEYVTRGIYSSVLEQMTGGGIWVRYMNITLIVLTNQRLLFINTDSKGVPKNMLYHQGSFQYITKIKSGAFGYFQLNFSNSGWRNYREIPGRDRKRLKEMIEQKLAALAGQPAQMPMAVGMDGLENLCTTCFSPVPRGRYVCDNCRTEFCMPKQAAIRSLIMPGLGDIYLRKNAAFSGLKLFGIFVLYIVMIVAVSENLSKGASFIAAFLPILIIFVLINVINAAGTYFSAKKGLVPLKAQPSTAGMAGMPR